MDWGVDMTKAKIILAVLAMLGAGLSTSEIVSRLEPEGVSKRQVRRLVGRLDADKGDAGIEPSRTLAVDYPDGGRSPTTGRRLKGPRDRDPASLREGRVFLVARARHRAAAARIVEQAMCGDFGGAECAVAWAEPLTQPFCLIRPNGKAGAVVAYGGRWQVTEDQFKALRAADTLAGGKALVLLRKAKRRRVKTALAALVAPLVKCPSLTE